MIFLRHLLGTRLPVVSFNPRTFLTAPVGAPETSSWIKLLWTCAPCHHPFLPPMLDTEG